MEKYRTMKSNENTKGGVGFISLLSIMFIGLKLGEVITWSWLWVLAPLWMPTVMVLGIVAVVAIIYAIFKALNK